MGNLMRRWLKRDEDAGDVPDGDGEPIEPATLAAMAVLEGDDAIEEADAMVPALEPETVVVSPPQPAPRHALDDAPINSKIVVVKLHGNTGNAAVLATPDGAHQLPEGDPAHLLPDGARIRKVADDVFIAEQLSPVEDRPRLETASAGEAIARFIDHFHH